MENNPTTEEILAEFEELLGGSEPSEDPNPEDEPEGGTPEGEEGKPEGEPEEGAEEGKEGEEEPPEGGADDKNKHSKQAQAFYTLRTQNKAQEQLIKNLGAVLGFDAKASNEDIMAKVQEAITQKQAKEQNIPVEILNRLNELETQAAELEATKHQTKVTEDLTLLAEKFDLDQKALEEFLLELNKQGKNPLENKDVNLQAEYTMMYFDQLIEQAKQAALDGEAARKEKQKGAPGALPGKAHGEEQTDAIKSVSDLDKLFDSMNI